MRDVLEAPSLAQSGSENFVRQKSSSLRVSQAEYASCTTIFFAGRLILDIFGVLGSALGQNIFNIPPKLVPSIAKPIKNFHSAIPNAKSRLNNCVVCGESNYIFPEISFSFSGYLSVFLRFPFSSQKKFAIGVASKL